MATIEIWLGIGCKRQTKAGEIGEAIDLLLSQLQLSGATIMGVATIDRKQTELGLVEYCREHHLDLITYSAEELRSIDISCPSLDLMARVGTPSVAEAAAILVTKGGKLIVTKQKFKFDSGNAVTIAIASRSR
jgi:cobalamin biosynthesis protein CbiG